MITPNKSIDLLIFNDDQCGLNINYTNIHKFCDGNSGILHDLPAVSSNLFHFPKDI